MKMEKLISIIIVNWNGLLYLDECISSLINQTYKNFEIILVDNASSDESVSFVRNTFPQVQIIKNDANFGFAKGVNIGIEHSSGEYIALFNQDAVAEKDWLLTLFNILDSSEKIAAVAGKVYYYGSNYGDNTIFCTWSKIDPFSAFPYNYNNDEPSAEVDYLSGCAFLTKREIIKEVGFLDSGYFLYFEETDWCARMIRAGYSLVYVPDAIVWHVVSSSIKNYEIKENYMVRNRFRFAIKNFDRLYIPIFLAIFFTETLVEFVKSVKNKNFLNFKIRIKSVHWNCKNLRVTLNARRKDQSQLRKTRSYNKSLPLKVYPIGLVEKLFAIIRNHSR